MRIIGHRGARREAPENTLGGFQHIKNLGIRGVEFDIRQLQDQELVVIHDDNFYVQLESTKLLSNLLWLKLYHLIIDKTGPIGQIQSQPLLLQAF